MHRVKGPHMTVQRFCWPHVAYPHGLVPHKRDVVLEGVKRARQFVARKELQKQAKHEYLKQFYESADRVDADHLVFELKPSSPRLRAQQQQLLQHAELNQQLAAAIPGLSSWQEMQDFLQQHVAAINFLNVTALAVKAQALQLQDNEQQQEDASPAVSSSSSSSSAVTRTLVTKQLAALIIQQSSWFQPVQFAVTAVAMACCDVCDPLFWSNFTAAAEHKVGALSFTQLAHVLQALAAVGFVPPLQWVERCYRQASKHLHAAAAADVAGLMWAWGEMGYTPRDILFMNQVKQTSRRAFADESLSGQQLVALMHGLARMPKYAPNHGWMDAFASEVQRTMGQLLPGELVDVLLSVVALGYKPPGPWMDSALTHLEQTLHTGLGVADYGSSSSSNSSSSNSSSSNSSSSNSSSSNSSSSGKDAAFFRQQLEQQLLLPPAEFLQEQILLQQQQQQAMLLPGGAAAAAAGSDNKGMQQTDPDMPELQELQQLFAEAAAADALAEQQSAAAAADEAEQQLDGSAGAATAQSLVVLALHRRCLQLQHGQQHLNEQQQQLAPAHLGILCWCFGCLSFQPEPAWMQLLAVQLLHHAPGLPCEVLADVLQGVVSMEYLPVGQLQQQLLDRALELAPAMPPECLRRLCTELPKMEAGLSQHAAAGNQDFVSHGSGAHLQQYLQQHRQQLAEAVAHRQGIILWQSSTQQLADVLAFIADSNIKPSPEYLSTAVSRAVEKLPEGCPVPALCTLLWALARLGFKPHPQLLHQLLAALQRGLHLLSSQDLADAGWALCTLKHRPGATWLGLYLHEVASKAAYMPAQSLTDTLWALACFAAQPDKEWLKRVVLAVGRRVEAGEVSTQNAAVLVWALQQLGFQPPQQQQQQQQQRTGGGSDELTRAARGLVEVVLA